MIAQGRVAVNGQTAATPAPLVDLAADHLSVDGQPLSVAPPFRYIALHKPLGVVSTARDPHADRTVVQLVPANTRLYPVGRLDKDSEGLILLTNDGELANRVTHPRYEIEKEYLALVREPPQARTLERLRRGVSIDGHRTAPAQVSVRERTADGAWLRLVVHEGRNREVRRMLEAVGHPVRRLIRTRIGPVTLGALRPGQYRDLHPGEVRSLLEGPGARGQGPGVGQARLDSPDPRPHSGSGFVVAIDGPSAAGKTTVGQLLAKQMGAAFLDTGVLYRALTLLALERGIAPDDAPALSAIARDLDVSLQPSLTDGRAGDVLVGDRNVTQEIRSAAVDAAVSQVASHPDVRAALVPTQRRAAKAERAVVVGRDIGTVIFPDADVKIYLEASPPERARRRRAQLGTGAAVQEVEQAIDARDEQDSTRVAAPLARAADAIVVDTDGIPAEEVAGRIARIAAERGMPGA